MEPETYPASILEERLPKRLLPTLHFGCQELVVAIGHLWIEWGLLICSEMEMTFIIF